MQAMRNGWNVVAIVPAAIASANSPPLISIARETTRGHQQPASRIVATPGTVAAPQRSLFQTDLLALKDTQEMTWAKRGPGVAEILAVNWP